MHAPHIEKSTIPLVPAFFLKFPDRSGSYLSLVALAVPEVVAIFETLMCPTFNSEGFVGIVKRLGIEQVGGESIARVRCGAASLYSLTTVAFISSHTSQADHPLGSFPPPLERLCQGAFHDPTRPCHLQYKSSVACLFEPLRLLLLSLGTNGISRASLTHSRLDRRDCPPPRQPLHGRTRWGHATHMMYLKMLLLGSLHCSAPVRVSPSTETVNLVVSLHSYLYTWPLPLFVPDLAYPVFSCLALQDFDIAFSATCWAIFNSVEQLVAPPTLMPHVIGVGIQRVPESEIQNMCGRFATSLIFRGWTCSRL